MLPSRPPSLYGARTWRDLLLTAPVQPALVEALPRIVRAEGQSFLHLHPDLAHEPQTAQQAELDAWYASSEGQETLREVFFALWDQMNAFSAHAMPAHDARHAMYKVPATALEYIESEKLQGWQRVGLLGALLHDHGRWAEERIFGHPGESVLHARMSFVLGREVLERFDMPSLARQHILLSALRHTSGAGPEDAMPLKVTVSADRDQLYGPEIVLRLSHHAPGPDGSLVCFSSTEDVLSPRSVLGRLSHFLLYRLPGPLFTRQSHVDELHRILLTFLLLAEPADLSRARFDQLRSRDRQHSLGAGFSWEEAWSTAQAEALALPEPSLRDAAERLLSAPATAPSAHYRQLALRRLAALPDVRQEQACLALSYADAQRKRHDALQAQALLRLRAESDSFLRAGVDRVLPVLLRP